MELIEVTRRSRNDFHWKGRCRHCGHVEHYGDGYADHFYCTKVVPGRFCPKCDLNCHGERPPEDSVIAQRRATARAATADKPDAA